MSYRVGWSDRLPYPIRDTLRRWREMVGMILGVGIALGIGMTFLGISRAEMELYTADYRKTGADLYVTTEGGKLIAYLPGDTPGVIKQAGHSLAQIRALPGVNEAIGITASSLERDQGGPRRKDAPKDLILTMGIDGDPTMIANALVIEQGRWIRRQNEVFIGTKLGKEKRVAIGDSLRLNEREFRVVGIGKLRGAGFTSDAVAYIDRQALRQRADVGDNVSFVVVDTAQPETTRSMIHELGSYGVQNFADIRREIDRVYSTALALYWILIALTLAIAGLFVSNMLSHSVAERRMEFATLRAIGVPSSQILLTIAVEATVISIAAWFVGLLVSFALGGGINAYVAPQYGIESLYTADAQLFALIFALALGLGLISGLYPARKATHIDPVIVLREA
jgi:ABC-type antimicrobial peptide transport system permease subunit